MNYINNTPHAVKVYAGDDVILDVEPSGVCYRIAETAAPLFTDWENTIPMVEVRLGIVTPDLPPMVEGTVHVVSMPLLMGMRAAGIIRLDFMYPYDQVRDDEGRIIGCRSFARLA